MTEMWYALQVYTGMEEAVCAQCRRRIPAEVLEDCFIPYREEQKKEHGAWVIRKKTLFPGYLFVISEQPKLLYEHLQHIPEMTRLLGTGDEVVPLEESEVAFLQQFGGEEHVVKMSEGIIVGSQVQILSGPLMGKEAMIRRIDRHKRKAYLELEMFGRVQRVEAGLEVGMKLVGE